MIKEEEERATPTKEEEGKKSNTQRHPTVIYIDINVLSKCSLSSREVSPSSPSPPRHHPGGWGHLGAEGGQQMDPSKSWTESFIV